LGYNKSSFALKVGISQPIITHITSGRNNPSLEVIQKILSNCQDVNPEWLILGRGEMLLNNNLNKIIINNLLSDIYLSINKLKNEVNELSEKAEMLKKLTDSM
jgi:predicted transcriptional regulator